MEQKAAKMERLTAPLQLKAPLTELLTAKYRLE